MPESISQPYDFSSLVHSRRSVRKYDLTAEFDHQAVARALELAALSPNSSSINKCRENVLSIKSTG